MSDQALNGHEKALRAAVEASGEPLRIEPEYLTPPEAAALVRVHSKTLERWAAKDSTFPVLKIAGTTRYPRERLLRWFRDREQGRPVGRQPSRNQLYSSRNGASPKGSS